MALPDPRGSEPESESESDPLPSEEQGTDPRGGVSPDVIAQAEALREGYEALARKVATPFEILEVLALLAVAGGLVYWAGRYFVPEGEWIGVLVAGGMAVGASVKPARYLRSLFVPHEPGGSESSGDEEG